MRTTLPFVSVILPVRNEELHIAACLDSILNGTYPSECMEILVVDGCSEDRTPELIQAYAATHLNIQILNNEHRIVPTALNVGIRASRGDLIIRIDAHASYQPDYVEQLVRAIHETGADNVGGVVLTRAASTANVARAIALVLSHPFGVGNSRFRTVVSGDPFEADTVPFGCYKREVFQKIGLFDERFVRNQDDEFNSRLKLAGGRIVLVPQIQIDYVARESLRKLIVMLYQYGYFKPLVAVKLGRPTTLRQLAPAFFVAALGSVSVVATVRPAVALPLWGAIAGLHCAANLVVSMRLSMTHGWRLFPSLLKGFLSAHIAYGFGYLRGILDFGIRRSHDSRSVRDIPLSR